MLNYFLQSTTINAMTSNASSPSSDPNKRRVVVVSTLALSLILLSVPLFAFSTFCREHLGIVLVFLGVFGEGVEIFPKMFWKNRSEKLNDVLERVGTIFWTIVVIGLAWEFKEAAKSDEKVATANEQAKKAVQKAAEANERASLIESNNLVLRSNVVALELDLSKQKRRIGWRRGVKLFTASSFFDNLETRYNVTALRRYMVEALRKARNSPYFRLGPLKTA